MEPHRASCTCSAHPVPSALRVGEALDIYLAENGFTKEGYDSPKTSGSFLGLKFSLHEDDARQT